jgi:hypothetical protein
MFRRALIAYSALIMTMSSMALAQVNAPVQPATADILVTARALQESADALAACLARNCPPDEDIRAALAHAENQFVTGRYRDARGTILASLRRNRQHREEYPIDVSDLMRANSRVAGHLGEASAYQTAVLDMRDTLRNALSQDDPRVLAAQIEVADSRARLGYPREARDGYRQIAEQATARNLPRIAAFARLRLATMDLPKERVDRVPSRVAAALSSLNDIASQGAVIGEDVALLAEVGLARIEREGGNFTRTQALLRRFAAGDGTNRPLLLDGRTIDLDDRDNAPDRMGSATRLAGVSADNRWIDVGFWINADGGVNDFEVLRRSQGGNGSWVAAVERSIRSRRYAPLDASDGLPSHGVYVIERYTLTSDFQDPTACIGSRLRCRSSRMRVDRIELTPDNLVATPTVAATAG